MLVFSCASLVCVMGVNKLVLGFVQAYASSGARELYIDICIKK